MQDKPKEQIRPSTTERKASSKQTQSFYPESYRKKLAQSFYR